MELLALFPLAFMICSDFEKRTINLYPLLIFGISVMFTSSVVYGEKVCLIRIVQNGGVMLFLSVCLLLYLSVRYKRWVNPFRGYFGSGDWWFLICLFPSFGVVEYAKFLVVSFLFSLVWWEITVQREKMRSIPLVSTVGICYVIYLLFRLTFRCVVL